MRLTGNEYYAEWLLIEWGRWVREFAPCLGYHSLNLYPKASKRRADEYTMERVDRAITALDADEKKLVKKYYIKQQAVPDGLLKRIIRRFSDVYETID